MNAYVAAGVGCTTYSFGGAAGVYYPALDDWAHVEWPRDSQLTFRGALGKTIRQPFFHPYGISDGSDRADIWYVLEDGSNLDAVVEDAVAAVLVQGVPFIDRLDDPRQAMESLLHEEGSNPDFGSLGVLAGEPGSAQSIKDVARLRATLG